MTIAHRSQYFHGIRIRNCVLEFSPNWSTSAALQRDCCVGIRDALPRLVPVGASNQSIMNTDSSGNRAFPVIVREQEFTFDFYWHELFRFSGVEPRTSRETPFRTARKMDTPWS